MATSWLQISKTLCQFKKTPFSYKLEQTLASLSLQIFFFRVSNRNDEI
jgi:hypothetical protein